MKKKIQLILLIVASVAMLVASGILVWSYNTKGNTAQASSNNNSTATTTKKLFDANDPSFVKEEITITSQTLADDLKDMGTLITKEYYFTQKETYEKTTYVLGIPSTATYIYSYDGVVYLGVDFEKIEINKDDNHKMITVTIPRAYIVDVTVDNNSYKQYESKNGLWSKITASDINKSNQELKEDAKANAVEQGTLDEADEHAEEIIRNFISSLLEDDSYSIIFHHN